MSALAREPGFVQRLMVETRTPSPEQRATLVRVRDGLEYSTWALLLLTLLARGVRGYLSPRRATVRVSYPDGRSVAVPVGSTVLEASRSAGIPHASVCGGRGRCSTCRHPRVRRPGVAAAEPSGAARAPARGRPAQCAPGLPAPPEPGPGGDAPHPACRERGHRARLRCRAPWAGARDRRALRRSSRLHPSRRAQAALRRRLLPQSLFRSRGGRHRRGRRHREPVHGGWRDGPLRRRDRSRDGSRQALRAAAAW